MSVLYLDCNATTPIDPRVMEIVRYYMEEEFGNAGSRTHIYGQNAKKAVERAREQVAAVVNAEPREVIFTSGATESNNLAILGLTSLGNKTGKRHIISTSIEHHAVLEPLKEMERRGFEVTLLPCYPSGRIKVEDLANALRDDTLLVSVMHVNNETGIIQPIEEIAELLIDRDHSAYFHVDAAQGFGKLIKDLQHKRIDLISVSGHKIYAPKGVGALIRRARKPKGSSFGSELVKLDPLMFGGGQEWGLRPGTLAVPLIAGLGIASEIMLTDKEKIAKTHGNQKLTIFKHLNKLKFTINGDQKFSINNSLNISLNELPAEALFVISKNIVAISNGSACTSSGYQTSHVLNAMSLSEGRIDTSIRLSWSYLSSLTGLEEFFSQIKKFKI
jgi:cysteine desulfurase